METGHWEENRENQGLQGQCKRPLFIRKEMDSLLHQPGALFSTVIAHHMSIMLKTITQGSEEIVCSVKCVLPKHKAPKSDC